ncbi:MAG: hypothetical protein AAFZ52_01645 [Bacteroidota bacterium]
MKPISFLYLLLVGGVFIFSACQEDEDPNEATNNRLQGDWDVDSYTIDGSEQMNFSLNSFTMEYTKQGPNDGEFDWLLINSFGNTTRIDGDYEIENSGMEIDFDGDEFDIEIDGDDLEIEGNVGGERWEIKAERD